MKRIMLFVATNVDETDGVSHDDDASVIGRREGAAFEGRVHREAGDDKAAGVLNGRTLSGDVEFEIDFGKSLPSRELPREAARVREL